MNPLARVTLLFLLLMFAAVGCDRDAPQKASVGETPNAEADFGEPCLDHPECGPDPFRCFCDTNGNLVREEVDDDGDGVADEWVTSTYDEHGNLQSFVIDSYLHGWIPVGETYTYDEEGRKLTSEALTGERMTYSYDAAGNLAGWQVDRDGDGTVDRVVSRTHGEPGQILSDRVDSGAGVTQRVTSFRYDEGGARVEVTVDQNGDGAVNRRCVYTPACPRPYRDCPNTCVDE